MRHSTRTPSGSLVVVASIALAAAAAHAADTDAAAPTDKRPPAETVGSPAPPLDDQPAPPPDDQPAPPPEGTAPDAGTAEAPRALPAPKLAPLLIPPDTEHGDSGDDIGFSSVRFGLVGVLLQDFSYDNTGSDAQYDGKTDTQLKTLQLRAFGQLPLLDNSFFLINVRTELSPRISFAMFQVPLGGGHYVNINSGGGSLSNALIISSAKQPLLEPAFWMTNAFEQGNGAAVEVHGPLYSHVLRYRVFAGGGSGQGTGNVGGQRITFNNRSFTYTGGVQLQASPIGYYDRFDSPFLNRPVPLALGINAGVKYEQRAQERFPAANVAAVLRWGRFELMVEDYSKAELNFGQVQNAYDVLAGVLLIPNWLFFAADFGQFDTTDFGALQQLTNNAIKVSAPPAKLETDLRRERNEVDARAALHFFYWRNNGILSLRYTLKMQDPPFTGAGSARTDQLITHDVWLATTVRF